MIKPTLSVVTIALNEERDMPAFIENFSHIADEIVIIDDGSTDCTEEIARVASDKLLFIRSPRKEGEGWSDQRNKGVQAAGSDWLLQVDVDMRLTKELASEILKAIKDSKKDAYRYRLKQFFINHPVFHGGFQYWNQAWLVKRGKIHWTQKLHERANIDAPPRRIGQLKHRMWHLNDEDFSERLRKNYAYSHYEADRLVSRGKPITLGELVFMPLWRAFRSYILMRGFKDGKIGLIWGMYQFTGTMTSYYLAWDRTHRKSRSTIEKTLRNQF